MAPNAAPASAALGPDSVSETQKGSQSECPQPTRKLCETEWTRVLHSWRKCYCAPCRWTQGAQLREIRPCFSRLRLFGQCLYLHL